MRISDWSSDVCSSDLVMESEPLVRPSNAWLGRVVNAMGEPIDGKGPLQDGKLAYGLRASPPPAHSRRRVGGKIDLGVRAINTFLSCCSGQRLGDRKRTRLNSSH